jgi:tryptophan synthase alpha chain
MRIEQTFNLSKGKKILSPYITAGDPDLETTLALMHELVKSGADIIELGIPFSDPMAEGPVIQAAMERALLNDVSIDDVFKLVQDFRKENDTTPIILMGYLNPIEFYGYQSFAQKAKAAGIDGTIIVDLPPEESDDVIPFWQDNGLHMIYLCSPTTTDKRMQKINQYGSGYLYYVSLKGVTGASSIECDQVEKLYMQRKQQVALPLLVGFGIKTPELAANIAHFADGVVVGAALINKMVEHLDNPQQIVAKAPELIAAMRAKMDEES